MEVSKKPINATESEAQTSAEEEVPQDVRPYDILCGRSKACFNNIGNRRFRITITMNVKQYDAITNRAERGKFIHNLARTLKEEVGFRFVRYSKKEGRVELSDDEVRAKIGHALRDLSKAQAEAAAAAALPLGTEEARKIIESSKPSPEELTPSPRPALKMVTPEPIARRVTNDFETDGNGRLKAFPTYPDIRMGPSQTEASRNVPESISFSQEDSMHPIVEEASQNYSHKMVPAEQDHRKPPPVAASARHVHQDEHDEEGEDDDYCIMPLRFDQPSNNGMLDVIPWDVLPALLDVKMPPKESRAASKPNTGMDNHDDDMASVSSSNPYTYDIPRRTEGAMYRKARPFSPRLHHSDLMPVELDDDHMISLCDSLDCLSLDLDTEVKLSELTELR